MPKRRSRNASVIDFGRARAQHRIRKYQHQMTRVLERNEGAIERLYTSGLLFSDSGARCGRDLLLARQHLFKVARLLARLGRKTQRIQPLQAADIDRLFAEMEGLLDRTAELTERSTKYFNFSQNE